MKPINRGLRCGVAVRTGINVMYGWSFGKVRDAPLSISLNA